MPSSRAGARTGAPVVIPGAFALAVVLSPVAGASAQSTPESPQDEAARTPAEPRPGETVTGRARPEYDPVGIRAGGFFLYPELSLSEILHDNVFYEEDDPHGDLITVVSPSARLQSNWDRHGLTVYADADVGRYLSHEDENYVDARTGFDGRLDITRDTSLSGGLSAARLHEARSSPEQTGAAEPVTYRRWAGDATLAKHFNKFSARVGGDVAYYRYDNVDATGGGIFRSDDRDRRESEIEGRLGYELSPRIEPFLQASANDRSYDADVDDAGVDRDSHGWETVAGAALDFGGVTFGELYVGYFEQRYERAAFDTISGPSFGGDITWNPTGLTTVTAGLERSVEETTLNGASGALQTAFRAGIDHELRRNVILSADTRLAERDYDGITREDTDARFGIGATYLANEYLELGVRYGYAMRDSTRAGADYDAQTLLFRVTGQL